jgi:hypothetical protein
MLERGVHGGKSIGRGFLVAMLLAPALVLSACDRPEKIDPLTGGGGLKGQWNSDDNVFYADFSDGAFVSRDTKTGGILATGQYLVMSASDVRLNWISNVTGQNNRADCNRSDAITMTCTDQQGKKFTLRKQA